MPAASSPATEIGGENVVNAILALLLMPAAPAFAVAVSYLQAKLEHWDYKRHAQD
jgi:hypothetical protein